ncbi:MAG: hypothetical protein KatS3mg005_0614 [Bryobacteraceae bacterium]|nr:MAG: hypothetical protein KatS3mg005_0614 [Bryobacteraceae bacterium]
MTQTRLFRILGGIACLIFALAAGAIGLMMGFPGTRREADTGSPAAFAAALLLFLAGVGLLLAKRR